MPREVQAVIRIDSPPRGNTPQGSLRLFAQEAVLTWSWGLQPAQAQVTFQSDEDYATISATAAVTIEVGGHTFYGWTEQAVGVVGSGGKPLTLSFVDSRRLLMFDVVYCEFNRRHVEIVDGVLVTRWWHILPWDFPTLTKSYTDSPYTAAEVLNFLFNAPTVESPWQRVYCSALNAPVYELDFSSGRKLGAAVSEVSGRCKTVFTLMGNRYRLVWVVKGDGAIPSFPANSDNRRLGSAVSGQPTRVTVLGDRNLYQVMNVAMVPDWNENYNLYGINGDAFTEYIYYSLTLPAAVGAWPAGMAYSDITDEDLGWELAGARAYELTVAQYAALRGSAWSDYGYFQGVSRMDLPVRVYAAALVFRAFAPPSATLINAAGNALDLSTLPIVPSAVVRTNYDPVTGEMDWDTEPDGGAGLALAQGVQLSFVAKQMQHPEKLSAAMLNSMNTLWSALDFSVDRGGPPGSGDEGGFIIFREPVVYSTGLFKKATFDSVVQRYVLPDASATFAAPAVIASLCFAGERFSYVDGSGAVDDVENVGGLSGQFVVSGGVSYEQPYADGEFSLEKSAVIANAVLASQWVVDSGGYTVRGSNATQLSGVIDRVTVRHSPAGLTEEVDFTKERDRGRYGFEPDRAFERRNELDGQAAGLVEGKTLARQATAVVLNKVWSPEIRAKLDEESRALGFGSGGTKKKTRVKSGSGTLRVGTPTFRKPDEIAPVMPSATVADEHKVFVGCVTADNADATGLVVVADVGIILARVKGPLETGDSVGLAEGEDYLAGDAEVVVGAICESIDDDSVALVQVRVGGGGDGGSRMHPFKIYRSGAWNEYRVRSGFFIHRNATLTDGATWPDSATRPAVDGSHPVTTVTPGVPNYYFWLEASVSGVDNDIYATVKSGADPTVNGWEEFGRSASGVPRSDDGRHMLIGWVDASDEENEVAKVRQLLRTDVLVPQVPIAVCVEGENQTWLMNGIVKDE